MNVDNRNTGKHNIGTIIGAGIAVLCFIMSFCFCLPAEAAEAGSGILGSEEVTGKTPEKKKTDDNKRLMTIEDYVVEGGGVFGSDLSGLEELEEQDEYDKVPGDGGNPGERTGAGADDWNLILVNKQHPVPEDYEYNLTYINDSQQIDKRIAGSVAKLLTAAEKSGIELMICSAYRSYDRQTTLFNNKMDKLLKAGLSYFDAYRTASYSVTVPGTSEHQLGLALDIITPGYTALDSGFADTKAGKWLKENAPDYGFILRYPEGKEYITGIIFEPWHFRYVGTQNAKYITENGLVLEEYVELLD